MLMNVLLLLSRTSQCRSSEALWWRCEKEKRWTIWFLLMFLCILVKTIYYTT